MCTDMSDIKISQKGADSVETEKNIFRISILMKSHVKEQFL